jgi:hypothetical protein
MSAGRLRADVSRAARTGSSVEKTKPFVFDEARRDTVSKRRLDELTHHAGFVVVEAPTG